MINQIDLNADNERHAETTRGYYNDDKPTSFFTNLFLGFFILLTAITISTIILGWIIGADAMVEMFGEWIYQIKY